MGERDVPITLAAATPASARDLSGVLTLIHLFLPCALLSSLIGHRAFGGAVLDSLTALLAWSWLFATPFVGIAALRASRRQGARGRVILNAVVLSVWLLLAAGSLFLHLKVGA